MDLSFPHFDRATELVAWPGDLAALLVGVAARQGASATAIVQAGLPVGDGQVLGQTSFHPAVAALLRAWVAEMAAREVAADAEMGAGANVNDPFTAAGQGMFNALCQNGDVDEIKPGTGAPIEEQ
ncbi:hypothetical protein [Sphingomonas rubra]|uniref:Uncharacterized protein n=1 Tax=Sphingomonas rubra TaxID=634430 RepID=A0A1I5SCB9_9SPHN|nr:hypothetical protein [Sphingomonas rubra]SFP68359.1 hypothetical protein SAMN04488241_105131 [Sphingomonas rubra]